jgi:hypothetical protein
MVLSYNLDIETENANFFLYSLKGIV